jgi:glycosyltransferase involved in cell wall biosynthesis
MPDIEVSLVTPTRDRPEAFALCIEWMSRQTYRHRGPVQWIVIDDGDKPVDLDLIERAREWKNWTVDYVRRPATKDPCTLQDNLLAALEIVRGDGLCVIEDDEWYAPHYLEEMFWRMEASTLVGECNARYYSVRERRWNIAMNTDHVCLCRTGLRRPLYPILAECARSSKREKDVFVDLRLWRTQGKPGLLKQIFSNRLLSVGIKGMPGRGGLGSGHRLNSLSQRDPAWSKLIEWIGPDARYYMNLAEALHWKPS